MTPNRRSQQPIALSVPLARLTSLSAVAQLSSSAARSFVERNIMKKVVSLLLLVFAVAGCATQRYDTRAVALPSSVGASAWLVVRTDHQTGESWFWRGDSTGQSKPVWHPIADAHVTNEK